MSLPARVPAAVDFPSLDGVARVELDEARMIQTFASVFSTKVDFINTLALYFTQRGLVNGEPSFGSSRWDDGVYRPQKGNFWYDVLTYQSKIPRQKQIFDDFKAAVLYKTQIIRAVLEYTKYTRVNKAPAAVALPPSAGTKAMDMDQLLAKFRSVDARSEWKKEYQVQEPVRVVDAKGKVSYQLGLNAGLAEVPAKMGGYTRFATPRLLAQEVEERMKQLQAYDAKLDVASREFLSCVRAQLPKNYEDQFFACFNTYAATLSIAHTKAGDLMQALAQTSPFEASSSSSPQQQKQQEVASRGGSIFETMGNSGEILLPAKKAAPKVDPSLMDEAKGDF